MLKIILLLFLIPLTLTPQTKVPMSFEEMYNVKSLSNGRVSPKGQKLLFSTTEFDLNHDKYITQLWIKDLYQKNPPYKVTYSDSSCSSPSWFPSGEQVSFITGSGDKTDQIFLLNLKTGAKTKVTNHYSSIKSYSWFSNDKLFFLAYDERDDALKEQMTYFYEEDKDLISLWEMNLKTNSYKKLTNNISVRNYKFSPDNKYMALTASVSSRPCDEQKIEIYLMKMEDLSIRRLTNNNIIEKQLGWSSDGSYITFVSDANEKLEPYYQESIFKLDLKTGAVSDLLPGFSYQVIDHQWNWKTNTIYFTANKGTTQQIFTLSLKNHQIKQTTSYKGEIKSFGLYPSRDKVFYLLCDHENPGDFYIGDTKTWKTKRLTNSNPQTSKYALSKYKVIFWKSYDGKDVEGILYYPYDYNMNKKYPLLVQLHGGPNSSYKIDYGLSWVTYPDVLTGKGYIVLQPNYRGSTGYGDDFMRGIIGNFFKSGSEDILSGVDYLVKNGIVDENKIGIMGYSAGAHFTNWLITQTNRFKVATAGAGASNWISFYAQNEVPYLREIWLGGNPYDDVEKYTKLSPITYAHKVKTPTFFFCGEKDTRVPFPQTLEMWRALKRYDVPTRLLTLPEEGHSIGDLKRQLIKMKNEFEWIEKYLK